MMQVKVQGMLHTLQSIAVCYSTKYYLVYLRFAAVQLPTGYDPEFQYLWRETVLGKTFRGTRLSCRSCACDAPQYIHKGLHIRI